MSVFNRILPALLFAYSFLSVLHPIDLSYDTDLFWHMKTGEVMLQQRGIPLEDPFTHPSKDPLRQTLVLRSSWLADILLYSVFAAGGYSGLVFLKPIAVSTAVLLAYLSILHRGVLFATACAFVLAFQLASSAVLKPNLFSFPLMAAVVFCMERFRTRQTWPYLAGLVGTMILWANVHGGYVFGVVVLGIYAVIEGFRSLMELRKGRPDEFRRLSRVALWAATAAGASLLNPGGMLAFEVVRELNRDPSQKLLASMIMEHIGYFAHLYQFTNEPILWGHALGGVVVIFSVLNLLRRKAGLVETAVVGSMLGLALSSIRVLPLFLIVGLIVTMGKEKYGAWAFPGGKRGQIVAAIALILIMSLFLWRHSPTASPARLQESVVIPIRAAEFLAEQRLRGNMLNLHSWGNYLLYRLYPEYRVFTDTRYVNVQAFFDAGAMFNGQVKDGQLQGEEAYRDIAGSHIEHLRGDGRRNWRGEYWHELLEKYRIDFIVGRAVSNGGHIYPIFLKLMHDSEWALVYSDNNYLIMVKKNGANDRVLSRVEEKDKAGLYDRALSDLSYINNEMALESLAFVLAMKGEYDRAETLALGATKMNRSLLIAPAVADYVVRKRGSANSSSERTRAGAKAGRGEPDADRK